MRTKIWLLLIVLMCACSNSYAANHYISSGATGSNNGSDWANAWTNTPATWVRGDTYYYADGSYTGMKLTTAESGTSVITIKKATTSDHGTEAGWSNSLGDGQAVFGLNGYVYTSIIYITTGYWVVDGNTGGGPTSWESGYGFRFTDADTTNYIYHVYIRYSTPSNITLRHIDIGPDVQTGPGCNGGIYSSDGADTVTIQYCRIRNMGDIGMTIRNSSGWVIDHVRMDRNGRTGEEDGTCGTTLGQINHGAGIELGDTDGLTFSSNNMSNSEATGFIGFYGLGNFNNGLFYNNIFYNTADYSGTIGNGVIYNVSGAGTVTNLKIYNNTFANLNTDAVLGISHDTSGNEFKNNIIYNVTGTPIYTGCARDHNASDEAISGDSNLVTLSSSPFTSSIDFSLTAESGAKDVGMNLSAYFSKDILNTDRPQDSGWDIGAYEHYTGSIPAPIEPNWRAGWQAGR